MVYSYGDFRPWSVGLLFEAVARQYIMAGMCGGEVAQLMAPGNEMRQEGPRS